MSDGRRDAPGGDGRRAGKRREIRLPVGLPGTIAAAGGEPVRVHVADLSRGGARCHAATPPPVGTALDLRLEGLGVAAIVCWVSDRSCGLRFIGEIRATDLLIQSGRSRLGARGGPDGSRVFVQANGMSRRST